MDRDGKSIAARIQKKDVSCCLYCEEKLSNARLQAALN
jgi:hypothetical protein